MLKAMITFLNPATLHLMKRKPGKLKKEDFIDYPSKNRKNQYEQQKINHSVCVEEGVQPAKWPKNISCSRSRFKCTTYFNMDRRLQLCLEC
jgi:hypothetical protein